MPHTQEPDPTSPPSGYTRLPSMRRDNAPRAGRTVGDFHQSRRVPIRVRVRRASRLLDSAAGVGRLSWRSILLAVCPNSEETVLI
jgi:hypothetical protein